MIRNERAPAILTAVLLGGVLILAAAVRMTGLADNPPGFYADEASVGVNAYSLLTNGREENGTLLPLFFSAFGEHRPPVFVYSAMPFVAIFGLSEVAVRLTAATYGTLTVASVFLLASLMFNKRLGLLAAFLLAIAPWHIHYSRVGFELITFPFFATASLSLFFLGLERPRILGAAVLGGVLTLYTYWAAWLMVPLTVGVLGFLYRSEIPRHRRLLKKPGIAAGLLTVPFVVNLIAGGLGRLEHSSVLARDAGVLTAPWRVIAGYADHFSLSFLVISGENTDILRHYLPGHGHLYWSVLILSAVGVAMLAARRTRPALLLLALLLFYPLPGALSDTSPTSSRTILGVVLFSMTAAYGVVALAEIGARWVPRARRLAMPTATVAVVVLGLWSLNGYTRDYNDQYPKIAAGFWGWQYGAASIVETFVAAAGDYDDLVMDWEFNSGDIFFDFYAPQGCDGCVVGGLGLRDPDRRQLFALKPTHMDTGLEYEVLNTIAYPNGEPAFVIFEVR